LIELDVPIRLLDLIGSLMEIGLTAAELLDRARPGAPRRTAVGLRARRYRLL
jgi:hypothetical protein